MLAAPSPKAVGPEGGQTWPQGLWCGGIPGYGGSHEATFDYLRLRRLVDRVLLGIFEID
jgi:hypothetical protein